MKWSELGSGYELLPSCQVENGTSPTEGGREGGGMRRSAGALRRSVDSVCFRLVILTGGY